MTIARFVQAQGKRGYHLRRSVFLTEKVKQDRVVHARFFLGLPVKVK